MEHHKERPTRKGIIFRLIPMILVAFACYTDLEALDQRIGPWKNIYRNDPGLAGVFIEQYPENIEPKEPYEGKHPSFIMYYFWDGRVRQIAYEPDGKIQDDFWWDQKSRLTPASSDWETVDFSYGSDPLFKKHPQFRWLLAAKYRKARKSYGN